MKRKIFLLGIILLASAGSSFGLTEVKKWEPFEIRFWAEKTFQNPYVEGMPANGDAIIKMVFTGTSGAASGIKIIDIL